MEPFLPTAGTVSTRESYNLKGTQTLRSSRYDSSANKLPKPTKTIGSGEIAISPKARVLLIAAVLLALFLGALDALVMSAAMPTIVADLGGLHLYSWVFSSYLLTRAISLPIFGKLCDLFSSKKLYITAILIFVVSSVLGGASRNMSQLILFRALQGVGAGGTFALAYIVVSDLSAPHMRGKMMGLISFVWGVASILGPALGGFIITYFSWRWIFYINLPLGCAALLGISLYLTDTREKKRGASIDYLGAITLSVAVLALLVAFMLGGRSYKWLSIEMGGLILLTVVAICGFYYAEKVAKEPILALEFFRIRGFSMANMSAFFSSFAIFSLSAYSPLYIQGALGKTPAQLGVALVPLSLAWSVGALVCGRLVNRRREKRLSILGSAMLVASTGSMLTFSTSTSLVVFSVVLTLAGLGMGFVSITTLLVVQNSMEASNLGVATSSQQFARTLGGTVGIGISGSLVTMHLAKVMDAMKESSLGAEIPASLAARFTQSIESMFQPEFQNLLSADTLKYLHEAVGSGVEMVFWCGLVTSLLSLVFCLLLPEYVESARHELPPSAPDL
jgi:EmrB/QacA subfamily drug resistance transporter